MCSASSKSTTGCLPASPLFCPTESRFRFFALTSRSFNESVSMLCLISRSFYYWALRILLVWLCQLSSWASSSSKRHIIKWHFSCNYFSMSWKPWRSKFFMIFPGLSLGQSSLESHSPSCCSILSSNELSDATSSVSLPSSRSWLTSCYTWKPCLAALNWSYLRNWGAESVCSSVRDWFLVCFFAFKS